MNVVKKALIVLLLGSATAMAAPASESSIKQLLMQKVLMEVQKMSAGLSSQMQKIQQDFVAEMKAAEK